jgi:hypothetical protein
VVGMLGVNWGGGMYVIKPCAATALLVVGGVLNATADALDLGCARGGGNGGCWCNYVSRCFVECVARARSSGCFKAQ